MMLALITYSKGAPFYNAFTTAWLWNKKSQAVAPYAFRHEINLSAAGLCNTHPCLLAPASLHAEFEVSVLLERSSLQFSVLVIRMGCGGRCRVVSSAEMGLALAVLFRSGPFCG